MRIERYGTQPVVVLDVPDEQARWFQPMTAFIKVYCLPTGFNGVGYYYFGEVRHSLLLAEFE